MKLRSAFKWWWSSKIRRLTTVFGVGFVIMSVVSVEVTSQNWFCNSCHIMNPFYDSWKKGTHAQVDCTQCHIPPGFGNFVHAKLNGLGQVVDDVLSRTSTKPSAQVDDASCTRSGCHTTAKLIADGKIKAGGGKFFFDHGKHLGKSHDGIDVRCTTCHSHVDGASHFKVNTNACVTCHLAAPDYGAPTTRNLLVAAGHSNDAPAASVTGSTTSTAAAAHDVKPIATGQATTRCADCHEPPTKEITFRGLKVNHAEYLSYGAACESCHSGVTARPQKVRDDNCFSCHEFGVEKVTTGEDMHRVHSGGHHKVECFSCHGVTPHGPKAQALRMEQLDCNNCHHSQHSVQQTTYKKLELAGGAAPGGAAPGGAALGGAAHGVGPTTGEAGADTLPAVSPMFMAHVDCTACHVEQKPVSSKPASGATVAKASMSACDNCHKPGLGDQLVPLWQKNTRALYENTLALLPAEDAAASLPSDVTRRVAEARQLLELVRLDGSWGVHNPRYTQKILEDAQRKLADVPQPKDNRKAKATASATGGER